MRLIALRLAFVLAVAVPCLAHADPSDLVGPQGQATASFSGSGTGSRIIAVARADIGRNPTGMKYLWCAAAIKRWVGKAGYPTKGLTNHSSSVLKLKRVPRSSARAGDIVYRGRRGGGHVELFVGWANAQKTAYRAITGNSCGKRGRRHVCEVTRSASRMQAVVRPR